MAATKAIHSGVRLKLCRVVEVMAGMSLKLRMGKAGPVSNVTLRARSPCRTCS